MHQGIDIGADRIELWVEGERKEMDEVAVLGRLREARAEFEQAYEADPLSPIIGSNLAYAVMKAGEADAARELFSRVVEIAPEFTVAHSGMAHLERRSGRPELAQEWWERARRINPQRAYYPANLTMLHLERDDLAAAGILSDEIRNAALHEHAGRADGVRGTFLLSAPRLLPSSFGIATEEELRTNTKDGITLGSHSWAHEHLPSLAKEELQQNLERTLQWLEDTGLPHTRYLSLPYGATSTQVERVAREAGHPAVLLVSGGRARPDRDPTRIPRINIPAGMSTRGMDLRLAGLKG